MLKIENLSAFYGTQQVLHDINLDVKNGEVLALIGPNGAGKSSIIRAISGVIHARAGRVTFDEHDFLRQSATQRARLIAVVPQVTSLPAAFTVWETVLLGRTPYLNFLGQTSSADEQIARSSLQRVDALHLSDRYVGEISGGEQQRILLARALAQQTPVLLLDEPTTHLDIQHQSALLNLVNAQAHQCNLAVLMVVHDLNLAALYADRVALLEHGRLRAVGTPAEILNEKTLKPIYGADLNIVQHPDYLIPLIFPERRVIP
jgi:ABC-type cobalamin/Fe3+-siderophores transport system ATPase subunit